MLRARFFLTRATVDVPAFCTGGEHAATGGFSPPGLAAWALGGAAYYLWPGIGGTLPSLLVAVTAYLTLAALLGPRGRAAARQG